MAKLVLYLPEPIEGCLLNIMHDAHLGSLRGLARPGVHGKFRP